MSELAYRDEVFETKNPPEFKAPEIIGRELGERVIRLLEAGLTDGRIISFFQECPVHEEERTTFLNTLELDPSTIPEVKHVALHRNGVALICDPILGHDLKTERLVPFGWSYEVVELEGAILTE